MVTGVDNEVSPAEFVDFHVAPETELKPAQEQDNAEAPARVQAEKMEQEVTEALETYEAISAIDARFGLEPEPGFFVTTREAAQALTQFPEIHPEYSVEQAEQEKPYTHYTHAGNIFQILRYGIQSGNFKNRLGEFRPSDSEVDSEAKNMNGLRHKQGASYQEQDSISLAEYPSCPANTKNIVFLVNPEIPFFGKDSPRESTGYGHGIAKKTLKGGYEVGNSTAYQDEVLGVNVVLPSDLRAVVIEDGVSLTYRLKELVREMVPTAQRMPGSKVEDLLANPRLIATLAGDTKTVGEIDVLTAQTTVQDIDAMTIIQLQTRALQELVGSSQALTDENLLSTIQEKFGITIITKPRDGKNRLQVAT